MDVTTAPPALPELPHVSHRLHPRLTLAHRTLEAGELTSMAAPSHACPYPPHNGVPLAREGRSARHTAREDLHRGEAAEAVQCERLHG